MEGHNPLEEVELLHFGPESGIHNLHDGESGLFHSIHFTTLPKINSLTE